MLHLPQTTDRIRRLVVSHVILETEQELLLERFELRAELLRRARDLADRGLPDLAADLRTEARRPALPGTERECSSCASHRPPF